MSQSEPHHVTNSAGQVNSLLSSLKLLPSFSLQTRKFYFLLCSLSTQPFNQNAFNFFAFLQHNKEGKVILKTVEVTFRPSRRLYGRTFQNSLVIMQSAEITSNRQQDHMQYYILLFTADIHSEPFSSCRTNLD